jgi:hypothetical protein
VLQSPTPIFLNSHSRWPVENAVLSLSLRCKATCQYPLLKSNVENHFTPASISKVSWSLVAGSNPFWWHRSTFYSPRRAGGLRSSSVRARRATTKGWRMGRASPVSMRWYPCHHSRHSFLRRRPEIGQWTPQYVFFFLVQDWPATCHLTPGTWVL